MEAYRILAINPGSTSTKVAMFEDETCLLKQTVNHSAEQLADFSTVSDQLPYRLETVLQVLNEKGIRLEGTDAFVGRGGGLQSCSGGVYRVNTVMLQHASSGKYGGNHPAALGCQIANSLCLRYGGQAFIVDPPDTDEFCNEARITGLSDCFRTSHIHALNQKETARRVAKELGLYYENANFIVCHIGGGVSVTAHLQGQMVDSNDIINGEGPMAPTRSGALPAVQFMDLCYSGRWTRDEMYKRLTKTGGFVDHLGTSEVLDIIPRIERGDQYAELIYNSFIYQIAKEIGAMAAVLRGRIDAIILTGGISHDEALCNSLRDRIGFLAPVLVRAGEFEMEALAAGALRVLQGIELPKVYTGEPVFVDFEALKSE